MYILVILSLLVTNMLPFSLYKEISNYSILYSKDSSILMRKGNKFLYFDYLSNKEYYFNTTGYNQYSRVESNVYNDNYFVYRENVFSEDILKCFNIQSNKEQWHKYFNNNIISIYLTNDVLFVLTNKKLYVIQINNGEVIFIHSNESVNEFMSIINIYDKYVFISDISNLFYINYMSGESNFILKNLSSICCSYIVDYKSLVYANNMYLILYQNYNYALYSINLKNFNIKYIIDNVISFDIFNDYIYYYGNSPSIFGCYNITSNTIIWENSNVVTSEYKLLLTVNHIYLLTINNRNLKVSMFENRNGVYKSLYTFDNVTRYYIINNILIINVITNGDYNVLSFKFK